MYIFSLYYESMFCSDTNTFYIRLYLQIGGGVDHRFRDHFLIVAGRNARKMAPRSSPLDLSLTNTDAERAARSL